MADNTTATAFASSSSAASSASTHFDIYISHRGPDVKNTIAANLYRRLTSHGLRVFLDRPALEAGKRIFPQIEAAIKVASVHIAIFSEDYASSKWCLDELRLMVDSEKLGATILPVFYKVKPAVLRLNTDSKYAEALRKHEDKRNRNDEDKPRYDPQRIQGWRDALFQVANISGFELEACNGDEAELLERIVQRVLKMVPEPELHVAKYATGLGEKMRVEENMAALQ